MDSDEKYLTGKQEDRLGEWLARRVQCEHCQDYIIPEGGFRVKTGEFVCFPCKPKMLSKSLLALCLDCGDYFHPDFADKHQINCDECKKTKVQIPVA